MELDRSVWWTEWPLWYPIPGVHVLVWSPPLNKGRAYVLLLINRIWQRWQCVYNCYISLAPVVPGNPLLLAGFEEANCHLCHHGADGEASYQHLGGNWSLSQVAWKQLNTVYTHLSSEAYSFPVEPQRKTELQSSPWFHYSLLHLETADSAKLPRLLPRIPVLP